MSPIILSDEVNHRMCTQLLESLLIADGQPVTVYLNSGGGDSQQGLEIAGLIKDYPGPIRVHGFGDIASAAIPILLAAPERWITPTTKLLIHFGEAVSESADELRAVKQELAAYIDTIASRVNVSRRTVRGWHSREKFFSASEALKVGLVDRVISIWHSSEELR